MVRWCLVSGQRLTSFTMVINSCTSLVVAPWDPTWTSLRLLEHSTVFCDRHWLEIMMKAAGKEDLVLQKATRLALVREWKMSNLNWVTRPISAGRNRSSADPFSTWMTDTHAKEPGSSSKLGFGWYGAGAKDVELRVWTCGRAEFQQGFTSSVEKTAGL